MDSLEVIKNTHVFKKELYDGTVLQYEEFAIDRSDNVIKLNNFKPVCII